MFGPLLVSVFVSGWPKASPALQPYNSPREYFTLMCCTQFVMINQRGVAIAVLVSRMHLAHFRLSLDYRLYIASSLAAWRIDGWG